MINQNNKNEKYIVFDVDETLGYFSQLGAFMDALSFYYKDFSRSHFERFNEILDLYPEFIRTNMIDILKYINNKKSQGTCGGIFIYTNNQGPRTWVQHIAKYFEYKVGGGDQLFDKIIAAYKVNGKVVEQGRTSQNKTYADLLRITGISPQAEVCFVDDLNHPGMRHSNVLYLNVKPYVKTLSTNEMIRRYMGSGVVPSHNIKRFTDTMNERMGSINNNNNNNNNPIENMKINLHESNYISLNTPTPDNNNVSKENKDTNEKLFNYIKLFLKDKQYSKKSTKNNSRRDSQTRHHYRAKHHLNVGIKTRKHKKNNRISDSVYIDVNDKKKTRRVGRFMRI